MSKRGYLSEKKRKKNISELMNISLAFLGICCVLLLFFREWSLTAFISRWLFQIYVCTLLMTIYGLLNHVYWRGVGLLCCAFVLFLTIGRGGNLFFNTETSGLQSLKILYQPDVKNLADINIQTEKNNVDIAGLQVRSSAEKKLLRPSLNITPRTDSGYLITSKYKHKRSGEILLSENGRAAFVEVKINLLKLVFITLDFSTISRTEQITALKNLAEFINMQNVSVIVAGNFGQEAWTPAFLDFLEKTGLEVKNKILLSNGRHIFNPVAVPTFNVLAYKDFGIRNIKFLSAKHNKYHPLLVEINY